DNELVVKATGSCGSDVLASEVFTLTRQPDRTVDVATTWNCGAGTARLVASTGFDGDVIHWYNQEFDVEPVQTGDTFETTAIGKAKTYFVEAITPGGCLSGRKPVVLSAPEFIPPTLEVIGNTL